MTILSLVMLSVQIVVQTLFLLAAFWIMIKLQKLQYNFFGLLASAAFVGTLDEILNFFLEPHLGLYLASSIATPVVVVVSLVCISKVTQAELVDVFFTVAVGRALWFGMNLWLMGAFIGDLRPASPTVDNGSVSVAEQRKQIAEGAPMSAWTNRVASSAAPAPSLAPVRATNAPKPVVSKPAQATVPEEIAKHITVKGVTQNGAMSSVTIQYGSRSYILFFDEPVTMLTDNGSATVRLKELDGDSMVLLIDGVEVKRRLSRP